MNEGTTGAGGVVGPGMIRHLSTITIGVALAGLTACGSDAAPTVAPPVEPHEPTTTIAPPTTAPPTTAPPTIEFELPDDPDTVVLQLDVGVNQPDPIARASGYPYFTLYADGRLIARDRTVDSGALAPLVATRIDADGVRRLVRLAIERGALDPLESYGYVNIADDDSFGFVVATADRRSDFGVYGLGSEGSEGDELTPDERRARAMLNGLRRDLTDWQRMLAGNIAEAPTLYTGDAVLLIAVDEYVAEDFLTPSEAARGTYLDDHPDDLYCVEVDVAGQPDVVDAMLASERYAYERVVRQVLPHESGCSALE